MKKTTILLFAILIGSLSTYGQSPKKAAKYNDKIIDEQIQIVIKIDSLIETYTTFINPDIQIAYDEAVKQVDKSIKVVKKMPKFDKSDTFKNNALTLFETYKSILENEHKEMVRLYALPDADFNQEQANKWDKLAEAADAKTQKAIDKFKTEQQEFADKYNLNLTD